MPTFAGYIMTPEHQFEWLRRQNPEIKADENYIPVAKLLFEFIHKHDILRMFKIKYIPLPGPRDTYEINGNLNPKRLGFMFVRRTCTHDFKVWIPKREIPGVASDSLAGKLLKKWGLVTSDWVVLHVPAHDSFATSWVRNPTTTSRRLGAAPRALDRSEQSGGFLRPKLRWLSWSFVLVPATLLLTSYLALKRSGRGNPAFSLIGK